jgi:hypothetical protein
MASVAAVGDMSCSNQVGPPASGPAAGAVSERALTADGSVATGGCGAVTTSGGDGGGDSFPSDAGEMLCNVLVQALIDDDAASIQQQLALLKRASAASAARNAAPLDASAANKHAAIRSTMMALLKNTAGDALNVEATTLIAATRYSCARVAAALMASPPLEQPDQQQQQPPQSQQSSEDGHGGHGGTGGSELGTTPTDAGVGVVGTQEGDNGGATPLADMIAHKQMARLNPQAQHILTAKVGERSMADCFVFVVLPCIQYTLCSNPTQRVCLQSAFLCRDLGCLLACAGLFNLEVCDLPCATPTPRRVRPTIILTVNCRGSCSLLD